MPVLRSERVVRLGDVEFLATLDFPMGMLPLEIHVLQVRSEVYLRKKCQNHTIPSSYTQYQSLFRP